MLALILAAPCLNFTFISDDFVFQQRATDFRVNQLLPDERSAFYRPISREVYFAALNQIGGNNPLIGHIGNALLLAVVVTLIATFSSRLGGVAFGMTTGLLLSTLGALPLLVGWVSCSQDLFAMAFVGGALHCALSGRRWLAAACAGAALLSKETAIFFLPGIVAIRALAEANPRRLRADILPFLPMLLAWAAIHPKIRSFILHGFSSGEGGYVGLDNPNILRNAIRTVGTFVNFPPTGFSTPFPWVLAPALLAALAALILTFWLVRKVPVPSDDLDVPDRRILWAGVLLGVVPGVATILSAKHWFPYYACMPAIGTCMLLALPFRRRSGAAIATAAAIFMSLGVWYRGTDAGKATLPAEANFRNASACFRRIETDFRKLRVQFPESARVYVAVQGSTDSGVHGTLLQLQAMRTWYSNSTIVALPPEYQHTTRWPEYLFWVSPSCDVFEIKLPELRARSPRGRPDYLDYQRTLRGYAYGSWAAGHVDHGVAVLLNMQEASRLSWEFDRRVAAALLLASDRRPQADSLISSLRKVDREEALQAAAAALTPEVPRPGLDDAVFQVLGLDPGDAEAYRYLMFYFSDKTLLRKTRRMAERLLALRPNDADAVEMLDALSKVPKWEGVLVPPDDWTPFQGAY